ncbi:MAG: trypsin-like serine protease [Tannerella sp.]|nr:trypsin-like serine protease [Tannerella sp.]
MDFEAINREDKRNESAGVPVRFGFSHDVRLDLSNSGLWQNTSDGGRLWTLKIESPDALSLNLLYDKFWLPDGAKFFIYTADKKQYMGAFTSKNNKGDKDKILGFATGLLYSNSIVLEYFVPAGIIDEGEISIIQVISGYRYLYDIVNEEYQSRHDITVLTCHNDINCPEGDNYKQEKNAIALMVFGSYICTGSLLNTTANDNRLTFLTANHCFVNNVNFDQYVFFWNYEAPTCGSDVNRDNLLSTAGSSLLSRRTESDFMLLQLTESPISNTYVVPYFLGWDRTGTAASSGAGIHHPNGAQKKISLSNSITNVTSTLNSTGDLIIYANNFWKVNFYSGAVEEGSSGSPLLNQSNRVVGQLGAGVANCPPNAIGYYGRFDVSWTGGGTNSSRLSNWLDPTNSNVQTLAGKAILMIIGPAYVCSSATFSVNNAPTGFTWNQSPNLSRNGSGPSVTFTKSGTDGRGWVSINNINGTEVARLDVWVGAPPAPTISGPASVPVSSQSVTYNAGIQNYTGHAITGYEWSWQSDPANPMYTYGNYVNIYFNVPGSSKLSLRACNTCGCGPYQYLYIQATSNYRVSYYPNPVSDVLHIDISSKVAGSARSIDQSFDIRLYDGQGTQLRQTVTKSESGAQFDVSGLPNGTYYLHVYDGVNAKPEMYQIIVKH